MKIIVTCILLLYSMGAFAWVLSEDTTVNITNQTDKPVEFYWTAYGCAGTGDHGFTRVCERQTIQPKASGSYKYKKAHLLFFGQSTPFEIAAYGSDYYNIDETLINVVGGSMSCDYNGNGKFQCWTDI